MVQHIWGEAYPDAVCVLGYQLANIEQLHTLYPGKKIVVYQLEQLQTHWCNATNLAFLKAADEVWDYAESNLAILTAHGITAKLVPLTIVPELRKLPAPGTCEQDIDLLFYGWLGQRRAQILGKLGQELGNLKIVLLNQVWGAELDNYVSRSKIILNLHAYDNAPQEQVRLVYLVANHRLVLSEFSTDTNHFPGAVVEADPNNMPGFVRQILTSKAWLHPALLAKPSNLRILVVAPNWCTNSAGVMAMHRAGYLLSKVANVCTTATIQSPNWPIPVYDGNPDWPDVLFLPEINNWKTTRPVIRWCLNIPGKLLAGPTHYGANEFVLYWEALAEQAKKAAYNGRALQYVIGITNPDHYAKRPGAKALVCSFESKGGRTVPEPEPINARITRDWPPTKEEYLTLLHSCKTLYSHDDFSMVNSEAAWVGAQVNVLNNGQWVEHTTSGISEYVVNDGKDIDTTRAMLTAFEEWLISRKLVTS